MIRPDAEADKVILNPVMLVRLPYLIGLESRLRILNASGLLTKEHLHVFVNEIDSVMRLLNGYIQSDDSGSFFTTDASSLDTSEGRALGERHVRTHGTGAAKGMQPKKQQATHGRRERILSVLQEKGQASIKDVSDIIKDCSEKTIQRELNALIKDNKVVRKGERRWSSYSIL